MNLLLSATAEEVQKATGYNLSEWDKFLVSPLKCLQLANLLKLLQRFTRKEAEELARTYPNRVWANYTTNEQEKVKERINKKLADNSIAQVGSTVIRWRMARCVRDVKHC